jgi:hypothetical protein
VLDELCFGDARLRALDRRKHGVNNGCSSYFEIF